ncbi:MAG: histidine phosphatase family protein [Parerythrobacter sp.]
MTKTLGLLRHAKSEWDDMGTRDFDRGLNARGRRGAALIGAHIAQTMAERSQGWDRVLASPAQRVRQTLAEALPKHTPDWIEPLYLADTATLFDQLQQCDDATGAVLMAGHNPGMQEMLFALVPPAGENADFDAAAQKYPTATFALFELDIDRWSALEKGCGTLVHFTRPRDLDPELGPEG